MLEILIWIAVIIGALIIARYVAGFILALLLFVLFLVIVPFAKVAVWVIDWWDDIKKRRHHANPNR